MPVSWNHARTLLDTPTTPPPSKDANTALAELKELLDGSRLINGKLSKAVISKAKKLLAGA